jgi:hypothetical protein
MRLLIPVSSREILDLHLLTNLFTMANYEIEPAVLADAEAITAIDAGAEPDPFRQFMEGTADAAKSRAGMLKWWERCIGSPGKLVVVARDANSREIVSYAQWELPRDDESQATPARPATEEVRHCCRVCHVSLEIICLRVRERHSSTRVQHTRPLPRGYRS